MLKCLASERLAVIGNHIEKVKKEKLKLQQNIEAMSLTDKLGMLVITEIHHRL